MKCISLWQPWAHLMVTGQKRVETRSVKTKFRGPLLIHAAKHWDKTQEKLIKTFPFAEYLTYKDLSFGAILGCVNVVDVLPVEEIRAQREKYGRYELYFGDYSDGRYGWVTSGYVRFTKSVPFTGQQCLFDVPVYEYVWGNNSKREELRGRHCILAHRSEQNTRIVVFIDTGDVEVVSGNALRRVDNGSELSD